ncbi:MAG TPA: DUF1629 domain-containing protein [Rhizomicrobium sp.]|jgi:hypothetical protein|nr:DUF1629 domain-containing protein [Rhizomicrobium sp.]
MYRLNFDALDGDVMKLSFADPVPLPLQNPMGNQTPRAGYGGGAPVSHENLPTKMRVSGRKTQLVDFNTAYHIYFVNRRFIDVVERFQTDIQYFPVECIWKDKTPAGTYYFFFTTVMVDAVIREETTATWVPTLPGEGLWQPRLDLGETFAFDTSRLDGKHMWVDPNMPTKWALVSDALYAALREAKIESFYGGPCFAEVALS